MKKLIFHLIFLSHLAILAQNPNTHFEKINDIPVPDGYKRISSNSNSFQSFLQNLKLSERKNVLLYNNQLKTNQNAQFAIIDMDIGKRNLQQCADAVIRLRAEYLWKENKKQDIHFNFTSGDTAYYVNYKNGERPIINGNKVTWKKQYNVDTSYITFRKYLETVFTYAGTFSLNRELVKVSNPEQIQIGDVFIQTGNPYGHAIIVVDMAINEVTGKKIFLLAQSYMPAQDIHILKNPVSEKLNPWYELNTDKEIITPEWTFTYSNLKRFKD